MAARGASAARELDGGPPRPGGLDVLAQHVAGVACAGPFDPDALYAEVTAAAPYAGADARRISTTCSASSRTAAMRCAATTLPQAVPRTARAVAAGRPAAGAAVPHEHRHHRRGADDAGAARRGGKRLGEVEEYFVIMLTPGRHVHVRRPAAALRGHPRERGDRGRWPRAARRAEVPAYAGGRLPLTTNLADRVRGDAGRPGELAPLPAPVREWLRLQNARSRLPRPTTCWSRPSRAAAAGIPGRLLLRGPQRAPDAGHAADPAMERLGLRRWASSRPTTARHLGPAAVAMSPTCSRGHAGRRSRGVDGRELHARAAPSATARSSPGLIERHHPGRRRPAAR